MTDSKPLNCPCCGSAATVGPHLIEAGCTIGEQTWPDWWTASVNCDKCALQFVGGGDTEEEAVEDALKGWNRRMAVSSVYTETLKAELKKAMELMRDMLDAFTANYGGYMVRQTVNANGLKERLEEFGIEVG